MRYFWREPDESEEVARAIGFRPMLARIAPWFAPHKKTLLIGLALMLVATVGDVAAPLMLRQLIDVDIAAGSRRGIVQSAGIFLGLILVARALTYLKIVLVARMGLTIISQLKQKLFRHVMSLSMAFFDKHPPGRLLARVESDTERLLILFSEVGLALIGSLAILFATLGVMAWTNWRITIGVIALLTPIAILNVIYLRYLRKFYARSRKVYAALVGFLSEHLQAVPILQVFALRQAAERRHAEKNQERVRADLAADFRAYGYWGLLSAVEVVVVMLVLYLGSQRLFGEAMGVGTLILFIEYSRRLFEPILAFSEQLNFMQRAFASADRVFEVLETPSATPEREDAIRTPPRRFDALTFEDVSFEYEGGVRALEGVDLRVQRGEHLAFVGHSGGGKSTLIKLLMRFYEPTGGAITVDGCDLRAFAHEAWRSTVGLVLQDIHLFPGTVRQNLTMLREDISDEDIFRALDVVQARDLIEKLDGGLDAKLAEGGQNLSMGERQLLSFARAIVRDPEILLLDEATSAVDPGTERRLQQAMLRLMEGRTAITVAHRLSTVMASDRIVLIHQGRIEAIGSHRELLTQSPRYQELCRLQLEATSDREDPPGSGARPPSPSGRHRKSEAESEAVPS
ncbi:MAG: ABC transporter ATP-binding protein [Planctomycetota bacterium]|jgi:ABC-type multidrug transport system fused ATPase/permease subunit